MAPQSYRLVMRTGPNPGKSFPLTKDELSIGRDISNDIVINDAEVSRHHARLLRKGDIFVLRDLDSTNGTWLHERQVDEVILQDGDALRLGNAQIVYKSGFSSEALTIADEHLVKMAARRPVVIALPHSGNWDAAGTFNPGTHTVTLIGTGARTVTSGGQEPSSA